MCDVCGCVCVDVCVMCVDVCVCVGSDSDHTRGHTGTRGVLVR